MPEPAEDCQNGEDDDGDGKRDCDDEDCTPAFMCAEPAPADWVGPGVLYWGPGDAVPACPADMPDLLHEGLGDLLDDPALCAACSCDPSSANVLCNVKDLVGYEGLACSGPKKNMNQNIGGCQPVFNNQPSASYLAAPPTALATGLCMPSGGEATLGEPVWTATPRVCSRATFGKGCGTQVCAARPAPPFDAGLCILKPGDNDCPSPYTQKRLISDSAADVADMRGCTPCTCAPPTGTCTAETSLYTDPFCNGAFGMVKNDGICAELNPVQLVSIKTMISTQAACDPKGGDPTGSIAPMGKDVTTACCLP